MYKFVIFIPETHLEEVKEAIFTAGAGKIGNYDKCSWQTSGVGQFRPLEGSDPFLGSTGELEYVDEFRLEMVCEDHLISKAVAAMKEAHPYEEPAYDVWKLEDL